MVPSISTRGSALLLGDELYDPDGRSLNLDHMAFGFDFGHSTCPLDFAILGAHKSFEPVLLSLEVIASRPFSC